MKRFRGVMVTGIVLLMIQIFANAQHTGNGNVRAKEISPMFIAVSHNMTSNLIFPYEIKNVDRGSQSILAQLAKGAGNVLQVKAGEEDFRKTNLSIITADGELYSFLVGYAEDPSVLNLYFYKDSSEKGLVSLTGVPVDAERLKIASEAVKKADPFMRHKTKAQKMELALRGIYMAGRSMWFSLQLANNSLIDYQPEYIKFYIKDRRRAKRTAIQEKELTPLYKPQHNLIGGNNKDSIVVGFTPFTFPRNQELVIIIGENNGGRSMELTVSSRQLLRTRVLPSE